MTSTEPNTVDRRWMASLDPATRAAVKRARAERHRRDRWKVRLIVVALVAGNVALLALGAIQ